MTKKALFSAALFFAAFFVFGSVQANAQTAPVVGGYQKADKAGTEVKAAVDFAVKEQGEGVSLVKIAKAEQQVVAGMNYRVKLKVAEKNGDKTSKYTVNAVIYRDLQGNYSVTSWEKAAK